MSTICGQPQAHQHRAVKEAELNPGHVNDQALKRWALNKRNENQDASLESLDPRRVTDKRIGHIAVHQAHDPCRFEPANIQPHT